MITKEAIIKSYVFLRENNQSIPDEVLDFIKRASLKEYDRLKSNESQEETISST